MRASSWSGPRRAVRRRTRQGVVSVGVLAAAACLTAGSAAPAPAPAEVLDDSATATAVKILKTQNSKTTLEITGTASTLPVGTMVTRILRYDGKCEINLLALNNTTGRGTAIGYASVPCGKKNAAWKVTVEANGYFACGVDIALDFKVLRDMTVAGGQTMRGESYTGTAWFEKVAC